MKLYRTARNDGRVIFQVADPSQGHRRLLQFTDETKAVAEAQRIANLLASGDAYAAGMRAEDRAAYGRAMKFLEPTGVALEIACSLFTDAVKQLGSHELLPQAVALWKGLHAAVTPKPVREAVAEYIQHKKNAKASTRYLEDLDSRLGRLADSFACDVRAVTTPALQTWIDALKVGPQSTRNYRTVLTGFFGFCRSKGWCAILPTAQLTTPGVRGNGNGDDGEIETFTPDELSRLLRAASKNFVPVLVLGAFAGLRSAEIERIHWEDIKMAAGNVVLKRGKAKTKNRRIVPLCPAAKAWLAPYAQRTGPVWAGTHDEFYDAQKATAAAAGLTWKANGLRHGYASHRLAQTKDEVRVAYEMGNSASVVRAHYDALVDENDAAAWFSIIPATPANVMAISPYQESLPAAANA